MNVNCKKQEVRLQIKICWKGPKCRTSRECGVLWSMPLNIVYLRRRSQHLLNLIHIKSCRILYIWANVAYLHILLAAYNSQISVYVTESMQSIPIEKLIQRAPLGIVRRLNCFSIFSVHGRGDLNGKPGICVPYMKHKDQYFSIDARVGRQCLVVQVSLCPEWVLKMSLNRT